MEKQAACEASLCEVSKEVGKTSALSESPDSVMPDDVGNTHAVPGKVAKKEKEGQGLTRKERKEMEKRKEGGKASALADSPYSIRMSDDVWNVEENARDIRVDGICISVPGKELFVNTSVKVIAGHRYGLIGPNGRGKSSVLRLIADGSLPVPAKLDVLLVEQEQEVDENFLEEKVVDVVIKSHKRRIAMLEEADRLRESGEDLERLQEIEDDLNAMGAFQAEAKARKILGGLGFPAEWQDRIVSSFSGGWRKRVALACAVFMEPDVLLLDEPTNHLDLNAVIWLETYLPSVYNDKKKKPKSLVVVSHDVSFLEEVCTDTVHIEEKKLNYYRGNYQQFLVQLQQHHQTRDKDASLRAQFERELKAKGMTKKEIAEKVTERFKRKGYDDVSEVAKVKEYRVSFPWEQPPELREAYIVKSEGLQFRYRDDLPWIFGGPNNTDGVDFSVWTDSRIALVGPNGCGKTTLIQILAGVLDATEGFVEICRSVRVGRYSQHFVDQLPLKENAVDYLCMMGMQSEFKARAKLGAFGLEGKAHLQKISTLSGGQKVRVAFAGISAAMPHVLLLDEPTNHLDMESIQALADSLNEFGGGVLVITHDARLIETLSADLWVVEGNNVVKFNGDLQDYREHLVKLLDLEEEKREIEADRKRAYKAAEKESNVTEEDRARRQAKKSKKQVEADHVENECKQREKDSKVLNTDSVRRQAKKSNKKDKI